MFLRYISIHLHDTMLGYRVNLICTREIEVLTVAFRQIPVFWDVMLYQCVMFGRIIVLLSAGFNSSDRRSSVRSF